MAGSKDRDDLNEPLESDATMNSEWPGPEDDTINEDGQPRQEDTDQTLAGTIVPGSDDDDAGAQQTADQTLALESADTERRPQPADQTLALPPGGTLVAEADSVSSDHTLADDSGEMATDRTLADSEPTSASGTSNLQSREAGAGSANDATLADSPADPDGTWVEGAVSDDSRDQATQAVERDAAPDDQSDDGTIAEADYGDSRDATQADTGLDAPDNERTMVESAFTAGQSSDSANEQTIVSQDISGAETKPRGPARAGDATRARTPSPGGAKPGAKSAPGAPSKWETQQRYQLVSNFARGGLGAIWLAQDTRLRREVAFKELLPAALKNRNALERFLEEAQITGQLEHPGIVPIYDIGYQQNGTPFYAMKLVRGDTMEKAIDAYHQLPADSPEKTLTFRKLLNCFIAVCNALAFAHDRGVLHRDLKPLNVMLGAFGETLVLDWGLAKVLDVPATDEANPITTSTAELGSEATVITSQTTDGKSQTLASQAGASQAGASIGGKTQQNQSGTFGVTKRVVTDVRTAGSQTMAGSVMGTPAYMPPEQAAGKLEELDPQSDIYSLGGILYKLLTGQQPIARGNIREILQRVKDNEIIPPRQHIATIPRPLEAITLKAMAKEKAERYASALDLAKDVEAWMADEPVSCFEDPWKVKVRRWMQKHPRTVAGSSATVALLLVVWIGSAWMTSAQRARIREQAQVSLQTAETAASQNDYSAAREAINEAIGRTGDDAALDDLRSALENRLALIESQRLDQLRRTVETKLTIARSQVRDGSYELARATLTELSGLLKDEKNLPEETGAVTRELAGVEAAIGQQTEIAGTAAKFEQFLTELDQARARGALSDPESIHDDAPAALAHAQQALALFDLDQPQPLASEPKHFAQALPWVRQHQLRSNEWPLDTLRNATFELLILMARLEMTQAQEAEEAAQKQAAEKALARLQQASQLGIPSQALLGWKAIAQNLAGKKAESDATLKEALALKPQSALDFVLLADEDRLNGRYDAALTSYLEALQRRPDDYWIQHFTGLCYLQLDQPSSALSCFSNCIARRPGYVWPHMLRGVCYGSIGQLENALRDFSAAEKLDPKLFNLYVNRGAIWFRNKEHDKAIADFRKATEINPSAATPFVNMAATWLDRADAIREGRAGFEDLPDLERQMREQQDYSQALDALLQAEQNGRQPGPGIHQLRGRLLLRQEAVAAARDSFRTHLRFETDTTARLFSLKQLGISFYAAGDLDQARTYFEQAAQLSADDPEVVSQLAEISLRQGRAEEALQQYRSFSRLLNLDLRTQLFKPEYLYNGMATAFDRLGQKEEAIEYYSLALMVNRTQPAVLTKRGWSYVVSGLILAKKDFEEARRQNPENPDTLIGLGYVQAKLGDWQASTKELDAALPLARAQAQQVGPIAFALFHNAATGYAQCLPALDRDARATAEQKQALSAQLVTRAIAALKEAHQVSGADPRFRQAMLASLQDEALDPLRATEAFKALVTELSSPAPQKQP